MGHTTRDPEPDISVYTASPTTLTAFKEKEGVKKKKGKRKSNKRKRKQAVAFRKPFHCNKQLYINQQARANAGLEGTTL